MRGIVVGVLRGGPSREHEVSLKTGHAIVSNLSPEQFTVRDIYIDRAGVWHERGRPSAPERILPAVDVVLIGLHGEYGEDGEVQKVLERYGTPYAGSNPYGSFLAMHKKLAKERVKEAGLRVARDYLIESADDAEEAAREITRNFLQPVVVKPLRWGSSVGVSIVGGYQPVHEAIRALFEAGAEGVLVEERITGREATAGVLEKFRGEDIYMLPPIEIVPPEGDFFSYDAKYSGATREICPTRFSKQVNEELMRAAKTAHEALGLRDYSRSDFIVSPRGVYYLETNPLPAMTSESLIPKSLETIGLPFPDFFSHLVELALNRK